MQRLGNYCALLSLFSSPLSSASTAGARAVRRGLRRSSHLNAVGTFLYLLTANWSEFFCL